MPPVELSNPPRILVVEDEEKTRDSITEGLRLEGWTVSATGSGEGAIALLDRDAFDVAVLDWMLPDRDGIEVLQHLRGQGHHTPVLMLTARSTLNDRVVGLDSGADDYLAKPFAFAELLARCRALLRRPAWTTGRLLRCGDLQLDTRARIAVRAGQEISLTPREVDVLEYLLLNQGQTVTREMLERDVWKQTHRMTSLDNVIDVQIMRLRRKVDVEGAERLIHTMRGIGYQLGGKIGVKGNGWRQRIEQWWKHRTIRERLALWYAVGGTLLLAGFAATLYSYVAVRMARPLDHLLRYDLDEVMRRLEVSTDGDLWWNGRDIPERAPWMTDYPWFEVWDEQGRLVQRMWPFSENRVQQVPSAPARGRDTISIFYVAPDLRLRVLSVPYKLPGRDQEWTLRIMRIHEPVADALGALRLIIVISLPIVVTLIVLGGYVFTRQWLLPLDRMAAEANRISADDLSRRLPVVNPHDELGRLASVFNVTLDRLQGSFDALDRFVADASHELRTPLTTLRSVGEVGLRRGRTVEEYREIIGSMLEEAQRLQLLIQRLLELASAEGGAPTLHRASIRVDEYAAACVNELGILAEYKRQQISLGGPPATVVTDPVLFRQALQNLLDNAIKYSPADSVIRVEICDGESAVEVSVTDDGPGISPENRAHLMERFFRPDRARGRNSGGFGLGLSITKAYMRVLGGELQYEPARPRGSTFRLLLPKG